jgi:hypothetical protein
VNVPRYIMSCRLAVVFAWGEKTAPSSLTLLLHAVLNSPYFSIHLANLDIFLIKCIHYYSFLIFDKIFREFSHALLHSGTLVEDTIKCVHSRVNVHNHIQNLASTNVLFTPTTLQVPKSALTHTKRITV